MATLVLSLVLFLLVFAALAIGATEIFRNAPAAIAADQGHASAPGRAPLVLRLSCTSS